MSYPSKVTPEVVTLAEQLLVVQGKSVHETANRIGVSTATVANIRKAGFNFAKYKASYTKTKTVSAQYGLAEKPVYSIPWYYRVYFWFQELIHGGK